MLVPNMFGLLSTQMLFQIFDSFKISLKLFFYYTHTKHGIHEPCLSAAYTGHTVCKG